jgi:ABC-type multidrug transport system fused ATPase/permease subunit
VQTGLNLALRLLLRSPFVVFGAMIMAFTIDAAAGAAFAVTIPALALVVFGIMLITTPLYKRVQGGLDKILLRTRENLSGVRVIRAFGKEDEEYSSFKAEDEVLTHSQERVGRISALMNPLTYVIINLGIVALIHIGAIRVNVGGLTQGQVIALYNYMSQILVELVKLANLIITISKALASAGRISAVLEIEPTMTYGTSEGGAQSEYAVELDGACLKYGKAQENSLDGISLKVKRGERIGIIGGTGSGKTSLINLIGRFYDATSGEVRLEGAPIKNYSKEYLNKTVSIVPQRAVLFKGTIRDNIKWGNKDASDEEVCRALDIAQATEIVREKGGLDYMIEAGGKNLSGGQRQRLTIARALVSGAKIIILDDSASALDFATEARLREALKTLPTDTTLFVVSQRSASVMSLDRIIVMEDGGISAIGTHDELYRSSEIYREIYLSQFSGEGEDEK